MNPTRGSVAADVIFYTFLIAAVTGIASLIADHYIPLVPIAWDWIFYLSFSTWLLGYKVRDERSN